MELYHLSKVNSKAGEKRQKEKIKSKLPFAITPNKGGQGYTERYPQIIHEILPVYDLEVSIRLSKDMQVKRVYLTPEKEKIDFKMKNGQIKVCVHKLEVHRMIVVEYIYNGGDYRCQA